jgi:hypothetical protein
MEKLVGVLGEASLVSEAVSDVLKERLALTAAGMHTSTDFEGALRLSRVS